jgi:hypothetical protein
MMVAAVQTVENFVVVHIAAEMELVQMMAAVQMIGNPVVGKYAAH